MTALIDVTLEIDNCYDDGMIIQTRVETRVPPPPTDEDGEEYEYWEDEYILTETGTGRTEGDSAYFVKCVASSDPALVGRKWEFC